MKEEQKGKKSFFCRKNLNRRGLYYKHITIVSDVYDLINKFEFSLTDDARVIIYDRHMYIVHGHRSRVIKLFIAVVCYQE